MIVPVDTFMQILLSNEDTPYLWDGKSPLGFDCSGLITYSLWKAGGPDWRANHNTDGLFRELEPVAIPRPGVLAFYASAHPKFPGDVEHVMACAGTWDAAGSWKCRVFGASGGDSTTTTLERAKAQGAHVRFWDSHLYRPRFAGFRALPLSFAT